MKCLAPLLLLACAGCVSTATHIVTAPVRIAGWGVYKLTTSQAEADRNRGRRERKEDKRRAKEAREAARRQTRADREAARESRD